MFVQMGRLYSRLVYFVTFSWVTLILASGCIRNDDPTRPPDSGGTVTPPVAESVPSPTPSLSQIPTVAPSSTFAATSTVISTETAVPTHTMTSTSTPTATINSNIPENLPNVLFLGDGPGRFTIPAGYNFIIKRNGPYRIVFIDGPTYEAVENERVWKIWGREQLFKVFEDDYDFGLVAANCLITYVQIDDDDDMRRNSFSVNGNQVHRMAQGMTVYGQFTASQAGQLVLTAEDSIAANIEVACPPTPTPTQTATPPPTSDATGTPTEMATQPPSSPTPTWTPTVPVGPAFTRFNFEVAGHVGQNGTCTMRRDTGDLLLVWDMQAGWTDSATHPDADAEGWIPVYIPHESVYIEVFCDVGNGPVRMDIYNGIIHPGTGQLVGWLTRGKRNAIEIGWPEG